MNKIPPNIEDLIKDSKTVVLDDYTSIANHYVSVSPRTVNWMHKAMMDLITSSSDSEYDFFFNQEPISPEAQECIDTINACVEHSTKLIFGPTEQEKRKIKKLQVLERKQQIQKGWKNYK